MGASIFSGEDRQQLIDTLRSLADWLIDAERAERCGVDCSAMRRTAEELRRQLEQFRVEYFAEGQS